MPSPHSLHWGASICMPVSRPFTNCSNALPINSRRRLRASASISPKLACGCWSYHPSNCSYMRSASAIKAALRRVRDCGRLISVGSSYHSLPVLLLFFPDFCAIPVQPVAGCLLSLLADLNGRADDSIVILFVEVFDDKLGVACQLDMEADDLAVKSVRRIVPGQADQGGGRQDGAAEG